MTQPTPDEVYELLRHLTPPLSAVTTKADGRANGFIINSAQRASLVPTLPRVSFYCSKTGFSHRLVLDGGVFAIHLLRSDQWPLIAQLGLQSGYDVADKLAGLDHVTGETGCPILTDCVAAFECEVVNAMDAGAATFVLGDVRAVHTFSAADTPIMTSEHFRQAMPDDIRERYEENLRAAQVELFEMARVVDRRVMWEGPRTGP